MEGRELCLNVFTGSEYNSCSIIDQDTVLYVIQQVLVCECSYA